jgi:hypothetical protein
VSAELVRARQRADDLAMEVQRLRHRVEEVGAEVAFGCVEGQVDVVDGREVKRVKLYNAIGGVPVAQARAGEWLKVRVPKTAAGAMAWYRVTAVDKPTGDVGTFYVPDRTESGAPAFSGFEVYPKAAE